MINFKKSSLILFLAFTSNLYAQAIEKNLSGLYFNRNRDYGKFTIAVDHNKLTGYYEFLDRYDPEVKMYMQDFQFFIKGTSKDGRNFNVIATNLNFPNENPKGSISFKDNKLKIILDDIPSSGCAFDITKDSKENYFPKAKPLKIIQLTYVNAARAPLFNLTNGSFIIRKGYLVKNNLVTIVENKDAFSKVLYKSPSGKISTYWIKKANLLDPFLNNWSGFESSASQKHAKFNIML